MLINKKLLKYYLDNNIIYQTLNNNKKIEDYTFYEILQVTEAKVTYKGIASILNIEFIESDYLLEENYELEGLNQEDNEKHDQYSKRLKKYRELEYFYVKRKSDNRKLMLCVNPFDARVIAVDNNIDIILVTSQTMTNIFHIKNKDDYLLVYENDIGISTFIKKVMDTGTSFGASDIKFLSFQAEVKIKFNIDGIWGEWMGIVSKIYKNQLFSSLANMGKVTYTHGMSIDFDIFTEIKNIRMLWRVNIAHTIDGGVITLRSDKIDSDVKTLKELGFSDKAILDLEKIGTYNSGSILITGGTRQGKTWTLNALLDMLANKYKKDVALLGNPIEKRINNTTMRQLKTNAKDNKYNITFDSFLEDQLRQNNGVIGVVEARSSEDANKMFGFAITDHLVLSTIHTPNFVSTLTRLIDTMNVPHTIVGDTLNKVISQRLIPALCQQCRTKQEDGFTVNKEGCNSCVHGYSGEQLIYEKVNLNKKAKIMISEKIMAHKIYEYLLSNNLVDTYQDSLLERQKDGIIDINERINHE